MPLRFYFWWSFFKKLPGCGHEAHGHGSSFLPSFFVPSVSKKKASYNHVHANGVTAKLLLSNLQNRIQTQFQGVCKGIFSPVAFVVFFHVR